MTYFANFRTSRFGICQSLCSCLERTPFQINKHVTTTRFSSLAGTPPGEKVCLTRSMRLGGEDLPATRFSSARSTASRRHATIQPQSAGSYWLIDLGSTHGTYLNEHRVVLRKQLRDGDVIDLAGDRIVFRSMIDAAAVDEESGNVPNPVRWSHKNEVKAGMVVSRRYRRLHQIQPASAREPPFEDRRKLGLRLPGNH